MIDLNTGVEQAHRGGRPRRNGAIRPMTVLVEDDTHAALHALKDAYGLSIGRLVDKMTAHAIKRLNKKRAS